MTLAIGFNSVRSNKTSTCSPQNRINHDLLQGAIHLLDNFTGTACFPAHRPYRLRAQLAETQLLLTRRPPLRRETTQLSRPELPRRRAALFAYARQP